MKTILGTHIGFKKMPWEKICREYQFGYYATQYGTGNISEILKLGLLGYKAIK